MSRRPGLRFATLVFALAVALTLAACGGSSKSSSSSSGVAKSKAPSENKLPTGQKKGGNITILAESDFDSFDPGITYEQFTLSVILAVQRPLYSYLPPKYDKEQPDLAVGPPDVAADGKTVTVKIRPNIKYSPPLQNRTVKTADIKYAIERAFSANVANPYVASYYNDIAGTPKAVGGKFQHISGIETPDDTTLVFKMKNNNGAYLAAALVLPVTVPVPEDYAAKYDAKNPSEYDKYQVFTGPYMVPRNGPTITGRKEGQSTKLVRNPSWVASTDYRPAYADSFNVETNITNASSAQETILSGQSVIEGNVVPPPETLRKIVTGTQKAQLSFTSGSSGPRYIAMNTTIPPFNDLNVRKAAIACSDRDQLRLSRGGALFGDVATHLIPPGTQGFEDAGGVAGFSDLDFLKNPKGDQAVCQKYFKAAGFKSGKYEGKTPITMVGENTGQPAKTAETAAAQFRKMGFTVNLKQVPHDVMYQKYCNVPPTKWNVCPNVGFGKDFNDAETLLDPTFNGAAINPTNTSNWPQINDPKINKALNDAKAIADPDKKGKEMAAIDHMISAQAPVIPWIWDITPLTRSSNVKSIPNNFSNSWDLPYTSTG